MNYNREEYEKLCDLMLNLIKLNYPDIAIEVENNFFGLLEITINKNSKLTILTNSKWFEIKRHIDTKLKIGWEKELCQLCCEIIVRRVSCGKCSNYWCVNCYIELFKSGEGIIICPYCRNKFGVKTPKNMIDTCVNEIKRKAGI